MRIPGVKTAKTFSRWLRARIFGGALILGYHRVGQVQHDEYEVCVTPQHFAEQMEALHKYLKPMHLSRLVGCLKESSLPLKSVAVTFDDGYADNLQEAKPILEKYDVPATVFVCTGYAGKEFWWDELDRLVRSSEADLESFRLEVGKSRFLWSSSDLSPEAGVNIRRKFRRDVYNFLLELDFEEQMQAMTTIRSFFGVSSTQPAARAMTSDELQQLVQGGLIQVGAHTRHHPMLTKLSVIRQREEVIASKQDLETWLGERVDGFAYPNGQSSDESKHIVREAGFAFACTSLHDVVRPTSDLHALTRFWQKDVDGDTFLRGVRRWMKGSGS